MSSSGSVLGTFARGGFRQPACKRRSVDDNGAARYSTGLVVRDPAGPCWCDAGVGNDALCDALRSVRADHAECLRAVLRFDATRVRYAQQINVYQTELARTAVCAQAAAALGVLVEENVMVGMSEAYLAVERGSDSVLKAVTRGGEDDTLLSFAFAHALRKSRHRAARYLASLDAGTARRVAERDVGVMRAAGDARMVAMLIHNGVLCGAVALGLVAWLMECATHNTRKRSLFVSDAKLAELLRAHPELACAPGALSHADSLQLWRTRAALADMERE